MDIKKELDALRPLKLPESPVEELRRQVTKTVVPIDLKDFAPAALDFKALLPDHTAFDMKSLMPDANTLGMKALMPDRTPFEEMTKSIRELQQQTKSALGFDSIQSNFFSDIQKEARSVINQHQMNRMQVGHIPSRHDIELLNPPVPISSHIQGIQETIEESGERSSKQLEQATDTICAQLTALAELMKVQLQISQSLNTTTIALVEATKSNQASGERIEEATMSMQRATWIMLLVAIVVPATPKLIEFVTLVPSLMKYLLLSLR